MEKRNAKLQQVLQMAMLRLRKDTLLRVELETEEKRLEYRPDPQQPEILRSEDGARVALAGLGKQLAQLMADKPRAVVRFVERGRLISIDLLPRDVKLAVSTLDKPSCHLRPEYGTRQEFIRVEEARHLLQALDLVSPEGKVRADRRRKFYQVDRFVELVDEMIADWHQDRPLVILDCGCGKSYLSFVLNYWLTERRRIPCRVVGIDGNPAVIDASREILRTLGYRNMEFALSSIMDYRPRGPVDMVLSLHACDTATDEALALGIHLASKYIIAVPCCQAALRERLDLGPWQPVARHNIFRNKLADVLTDGLRVAALEARGYRVSVSEYVSPLDTPKNIMLRAVARDGKGNDAYNGLKQHVEGELPLEICLARLASR